MLYIRPAIHYPFSIYQRPSDPSAARLAKRNGRCFRLQQEKPPFCCNNGIGNASARSLGMFEGPASSLQDCMGHRASSQVNVGHLAVVEVWTWQWWHLAPGSDGGWHLAVVEVGTWHITVVAVEGIDSRKCFISDSRKV